LSIEDTLNAPWLDEYVVELVGFPGTKHDDQMTIRRIGTRDELPL